MEKNSFKFFCDEKKKEIIFEWKIARDTWHMFSREFLFFLEKERVEFIRNREYDVEQASGFVLVLKDKDNFLKVKDYLVLKFGEL